MSGAFPTVALLGLKLIAEGQKSGIGVRCRFHRHPVLWAEHKTYFRWPGPLKGGLGPPCAMAGPKNTFSEHFLAIWGLNPTAGGQKPGVGVRGRSTGTPVCRGPNTKHIFGGLGHSEPT